MKTTRIALLALASLVLAAAYGCSSSSSSNNNSSSSSGGGGGGGGNVSCDTVCGHIQDVCNGQAPSGCAQACSGWSADLKACVNSASSCAAANTCGNSGGSSSSSSSSSGATSSSSSSSSSSSGGASACGKANDACTKDTDCLAVILGCEDNTTGNTDGVCIDGKCKDQTETCNTTCTGLGSKCAGIAYLPCKN